jgi:Flp pilus assembly protein CpaB
VSGIGRRRAIAALALALALVAGVVAGGCGPTPEPEPIQEPPAASATGNGITLAVRAARVVTAGETLWADVVADVTAPVDYGGGLDSCDQDVWVTVRRIPPELPGPKLDDRLPLDPAVERAYELLQPGDGEPAGRFRSQDERASQATLDARVPPFLGRDLFIVTGCGQPLVAKTLAPGAPVTDRMDWATTTSGAPILPGDYVATFGFGVSVDRPGGDPLVTVEVPIRVTEPLLPPMARDTVARLILRDDRVVAWHRDVSIDRWGGSGLVYADGAWSYLVRFDDSKLFVVVADGRSGAIKDVRFEDHAGRIP